MLSLFLHRISGVRVYLSIAATTPDPAGWDLRQVRTLQLNARVHFEKISIYLEYLRSESQYIICMDYYF